MLFAVSLLATPLLAQPAGASEVVLQMQDWPSSDEGFEQFAERIDASHGRNLLARRAVRIVLDKKSSVGGLYQLFDGQAGIRGAEGRVMISGRPIEINFYLGEPKTITEVGAFTFNGDTRSNQDFEVRLADNSANPGVRPKFAGKADLTSGDVILGRDRGGFLSRFARSDGAPLVPGKVDWVQFRIWQTHKGQAGARAKTGQPSGASSYIELEVLGEAGDIVLPTPEQLALRKAFQEAPTAPKFIEKPTWRETMIANREAIQQWETVQDVLASYRANPILDSWHVLGPLAAKSQELAELRKATQIDLTRRYTGASGKQVGWQQRDDLADGKVHDLTSLAVNKSDIFLLCRPVTFLAPMGKAEYLLEINADRGSALWLPSRRRHSVSNSFTLTKGGAELKELTDRCQLLLELKAGTDGMTRFRCLPQPQKTRPGAGTVSTRLTRRRRLESQLIEQATDPVDRARIRWETGDKIWNDYTARNVQEWLPGHADVYLRPKYDAAIADRLARLEESLLGESGIEAEVLAPLKPRIEAWLARFRTNDAAELNAAQLRARHYQVAALQDALAVAGKVRSMRLSVEDQRTMFEDRYPRADEYLGQIAAMKKKADALIDRLLGGDDRAVAAVGTLNHEIERAGAEILLANPLLDFDRLLVAKGNPSFSSNWGGPNSIGKEMVVLSPVRPDGQLTTIHEGTIADMNLHWDGRRILFSDRKTLWQINADGSDLTRITPEDDLIRYDGCYLPGGQIALVSNACQQAVPCTGGPNVGNIHVINPDGSGERRLTFDQDHDWNPVVMHDGRVLYTRWEYTDAPHYFSRLLFRMNPDGTGQMEYYGSNSYWPNAMYWPQPIPGHPTMISCVVSGHHGVSRCGEMLLLDPSKGRHEADGAVQKIPGYGKKVEPTMMDRLVVESWPKFAAPYPLAEPGTHLGAGKYFLACVKQSDSSTWDLCLVDIYDNITPILTGGYMTPIPLRPRPMPPAIPSQVDPTKKDATVYLADVYAGPGLKGFPRGSIKRLRVGTHHYRYFGNGDTRASSLEGGWDVKRILGTVPVHEDGSALFTVPANTPIFLQPLDDEGKSQQVMRSWFTAMPGEFLSCIGCHEKQNAGPTSRYNTAAFRQQPSKIEPWYGPARGFSFDREIQPVLDRRCVGCHSDRPYDAGAESLVTIDLRAKRLHGDIEATDPTAPKTREAGTDYSPAYLALQRYVRRPGYESDYHMPKPAEYEAETSMLVQMLKKGHYNVQLTDEEWQRLYTWIDYNIPYPANWRESHRPPTDDQVAIRAKYKKLYAGIDDRDEEPLPLPPIAPFEKPAPAAARASSPLQLAGWPIAADDAKKMQQKAGPIGQELDLGDGLSMRFALIPTGRFVMGHLGGFDDEARQAVVQIERPFYMGRFEVTNGQFARFDAEHNSGVINERWKDRSRRGTPIDAPELPVVRITWHEAMDFCRWLSERTGRHCTLPTEAQWEWACRSGTATTFAAGEYTPETAPFANIADETARKWNHGRAQDGYNDGISFTAEGGRFAPNAWGLHDMHGNVAEWCKTTYRPYPYKPGDSRDGPADEGPKVVRGGSWNDTLRHATSASRWRYEPYKPVYNVGFRVVFEVQPQEVVATAEGM